MVLCQELLSFHLMKILEVLKITEGVLYSGIEMFSIQKSTRLYLHSVCFFFIGIISSLSMYQNFSQHGPKASA